MSKETIIVNIKANTDKANKNIKELNKNLDETRLKKLKI